MIAESLCGVGFVVVEATTVLHVEAMLRHFRFYAFDADSFAPGSRLFRIGATRTKDKNKRLLPGRNTECRASIDAV